MKAIKQFFSRSVFLGIVVAAALGNPIAINLVYALSALYLLVFLVAAAPISEKEKENYEPHALPEWLRNLFWAAALIILAAGGFFWCVSAWFLGYCGGKYRREATEKALAQ
jgi:hypothetical protein